MEQENNELSIYSDPLTNDGIVINIARIKKAFPQLPIGFYDVLTDMLVKDGFTNQRFTDAVDQVLRTCMYPQPTIAEFISFDRKIKLYSHDEVIQKSMEYGKKLTDVFEMIEIKNKKYWKLK